jgi:hypothetical protein
MRKKDKKTGTDETINLIAECEDDVLSTVDNENLPISAKKALTNPLTNSDNWIRL